MKRRLEVAKAHAWRRWRREFIQSLMEMNSELKTFSKT